MSIRKISLLLLLLGAALKSYPVDMEKVFEAANLDYKTKNYEKAVQEYEQVIAGGKESSALYFNLGNAYYKLNNLPAAILFYEKALKLKPGEEDVRFNLMLANTKIVDKIEAIPELFIYRWWKSLRSLYSPDGWAVVCILFSALFFLFTTLYLLMKPMIVRKFSFWIAFIFLLTAGFSYTFASQSHQKRTNQQQAIIFQPAVNVKSSPDENSVDLFIIHEGTKVTISDNLGNWYKIVIANGSVGWVQADVMKMI